MNSNSLEQTGGRIYLIRTAQNAIDMANIIVGNVQRRKIGHFIRAEGLIPRRLRRNKGY